jgi:hypothetical protein
MPPPRNSSATYSPRFSRAQNSRYSCEAAYFGSTNRLWCRPCTSSRRYPSTARKLSFAVTTVPSSLNSITACDFPIAASWRVESDADSDSRSRSVATSQEMMNPMGLPAVSRADATRSSSFSSPRGMTAVRGRLLGSAICRRMPAGSRWNTSMDCPTRWSTFTGSWLSTAFSARTDALFRKRMTWSVSVKMTFAGSDSSRPKESATADSPVGSASRGWPLPLAGAAGALKRWVGTVFIGSVSGGGVGGWTVG